jgi:predicted dehydrogenase
MIKIGLVNIDTSHPKEFAVYLNKNNRARYTAIYNYGFRSDSNVETFMKKFDVTERYYSLDELAENVDIGFIHSCNWSKHLNHALPFINKGKPVFIDKPIVGSIADCNKLEQLAEQGAVIIGGSSLRYAEEIQNFIKQSEEERGRILNIHATCGVDEFNYGIHVTEAICELAQSEPVSVRYVGKIREGKYSCKTYFVTFNNNTTATFNLFGGEWRPFDFVIMTTKGTFYFRVDVTKIYGALLDRVCSFMESEKKNWIPVSKLIQPVKVLIAGKVSQKREGKTVNIVDIPEDDPGFDGDSFEKFYSANAPNIYDE